MHEWISNNGCFTFVIDFTGCILAISHLHTKLNIASMIGKNGNDGSPDLFTKVLAITDFRLENDESMTNASQREGLFSAARNAAAPPIETPSMIIGTVFNSGLSLLIQSITARMSLYS